MKTEKYKLTKEEIRSAFEVTGQLQQSPIKKIIIGVLFVVCLIVSAVNIFTNPTQIQSYVLVGLVIAVLIFALVANRKSEENMVERAYKNAGDGTVTEFINQDGEKKITVTLPDTDIKWDVIPDECGSIYESDLMLCIFLTDKRIVVFPRRVLNDEMTDFILKFKQ